MGGLLAIATSLQDTPRLERQLRGRAGRQVWGCLLGVWVYGGMGAGAAYHICRGQGYLLGRLGVLDICLPCTPMPTICPPSPPPTPLPYAPTLSFLRVTQAPHWPCLTCLTHSYSSMVGHRSLGIYWHNLTIPQVQFSFFLFFFLCYVGYMVHGGYRMMHVFGI